MSLRVKMGLPVALLLMVTALFQMAYFPARMTSQGENWAERRALGVASVLATVLGPAVEFEDEASVNEVLKGLRAMPEVAYAGVRRANGEMLGALNADKVPPAPAGNASRLRVVRGEHGLDVVAQVQGKAGGLGLVQLGFSLTELEAEAQDNRQVVGAVSLVTFTLGLALALVMATLFLRPIRRLTRATELIVSRGDLTQALQVRGTDEVGMLARTFGSMVARLRTVLITVGRLVTGMADVGSQAGKASATVSQGAAAVLNRMAETSELTAQSLQVTREVASGANALRSRLQERLAGNEEMARANEAVGRRVTETASSVEGGRAALAHMALVLSTTAQRIADVHKFVQDTSSSVREIAQGSDQIDAHATTSVQLARKVAEDAALGQAAVAKTLDGITNIRQSSWAMARELAQLEERSTAIGGMVEVIGKVANQTRLLAINASIIASTGGEAGRAFAVVADETRELAVRTSEATLEISKRIEGVQEGARAAKRTMETSLVNVEEGMLLGQDTARALMEILDGSQSAASRAEAIASAAQVQARSAQRISQSVAHVANVVDELNHASAQQAQESVRAVASSQTVESLTREVQRLVEAHARTSATDDAFLRDLARTLEQMMGAQHQQKSNAEKVAAAVADVERVARRQAEEVHALEAAVRLVVEHAGVLQAEVRQFKV